MYNVHTCTCTRILYSFYMKSRTYYIHDMSCNHVHKHSTHALCTHTNKPSSKGMYCIIIHQSCIHIPFLAEFSCPAGEIDKQVISMSQGFDRDLFASVSNRVSEGSIREAVIVTSNHSWDLRGRTVVRLEAGLENTQVVHGCMWTTGNTAVSLAF